MKIIVVGAAGDIGQIVTQDLGTRHDVIPVGRTKGAYRLDVSDFAAVEALYRWTGPVDAVVSCAGDATFAPLTALDPISFMVGLQQKVMGQVNLVLAGLNAINDGGSVTLTSGVLDRDPVPEGTNAATANGALAGFVTSAAIEMPRGLRVNVVSPGLLEVSVERYGALFPGHRPVASDAVALAYRKCVEGALTGQTVIVD